MHGMMKDMRDDADMEDQSEEEPIEEDICDHRGSPLINAHTKQQTGKKA